MESGIIMALAYRETAIGRIGIEERDGAVTRLFFADCEEGTATAGGETPLLAEAFRQLEAYLAGELTAFSLPLAPAGTPFQRSVWKVLETIPYGEAWSYKEVATRVGNPKATRAVGMANNRNPIAIVIPCHRVIGADGSLVGYGGGLERKVRLLALEKCPMTNMECPMPK
jgi:methylated-DNA-[protein]-cysteine S-methyltransferase